MDFENMFTSDCWPKPRLEVERMKPYTAPLEGRRELLRLDFNENTIGPSPLVLDAVHKITSRQIAIYPEYDGLKEAVVANLCRTTFLEPLRPEQIGLFNGVDAAIHAICHAYGDRGDLLLTTTPTFGYYIPCANMQGMEVMALPYEGKEFRFPLMKMKLTLKEKKPRLLLLCNPNNPTGTRLSAKYILELAAKFPKTLIVVDELYEAFTGESVLPLVDFKRLPNLLILRSLSKTAGLAGLRIGFAIGWKEVVERVCRVTGPYDINSFAVAAAFAAMEDQQYIDAYVSEVLEAKEWIKSQLQKSGLRYQIDGGNYFLIWPRSEPSELAASLRMLGILVRDMSDKNFIEGSLRVSIGTKSQMMQFWNIFAQLEKLKS